MNGSVVAAIAAGVAVGLNGYAWWKARRAETRFPPTSEFVMVQGARTHFVRKGKGRPVVLLHGSDGFLQDFPQTLLDALAEDYTVIALDRPGHGWSDVPPDTDLSPIGQARWLRAVLKKLGIAKPLLVGHSWSGALLMAYALEYPDEAAGLILLAGWVYAPDGFPPLLLWLLQIPLLGPFLVGTFLTPVRRLLIRQNLVRAFAPDAVPSAYSQLAQALWQRRSHQTIVFARENISAWPTLRALAPRYAEVRLPLLMVTGEQDRIVSPADHAGRLHSALPHSAWITLPETGHEIAITKPEAVVEAVRRVWEDSDERAAASLQEMGDRSSESASASPEYALARALVFRYGWNATAYQILTPAMLRWFSEDGDAVVGYVQRAKVRVVAGAPVCAEARLPAVLREFEAAAARAGDKVCYFGGAARLQSVLATLDSHSSIVIGAQPVWNPQHWHEMLKRNASLRAQINRARNKGVEVREWPAERADRNPSLQRCLDEWIATRLLPPLHFLTEAVTLDRLADRRLFVAEAVGEPVAFLVATPVPDRNGWLVEQIVRGKAAANGAAERMVDAAMQTLAAEGCTYVTLGLAPLSRRVSPPMDAYSPGMQVFLAWVRAHGRRFYNFDGLDAFKAKFKPDAWEPLFATANEPRFSFHTLYAIAAAFSDGPPIGALLRAMLAAFRQECVWLWQRFRLHRV